MHRLLTASARPCRMFSGSDSWPFPTRPTNCVNRRSNSGRWRSQRRSADSLDSARRLVHAITPTPPPHDTIRLFGPLMVRRLNYLTCHWALPRFTSAVLQVFHCQDSSLSAGAQAAVQWSDNRRLVDGWSESLEPRKHFFLGRVNPYQGFRLETHNKTGLQLICCHMTQVSATG